MEKELSPIHEKKARRYAYATVTVITMLALLGAALLVSVANDMYAFVKPQREVSLSLDAPLSLSELAALLEREGIVANPTIFTLYTKVKNKVARVEAFSGEITLNSAMSYREILAAFAVD